MNDICVCASSILGRARIQWCMAGCSWAAHCLRSLHSVPLQAVDQDAIREIGTLLARLIKPSASLFQIQQTASTANVKHRQRRCWCFATCSHVQCPMTVSWVDRRGASASELMYVN